VLSLGKVGSRSATETRVENTGPNRRRLFRPNGRVARRDSRPRSEIQSPAAEPGTDAPGIALEGEWNSGGAAPRASLPLVRSLVVSLTAKSATWGLSAREFAVGRVVEGKVASAENPFACGGTRFQSQGAGQKERRLTGKQSQELRWSSAERQEIPRPEAELGTEVNSLGKIRSRWATETGHAKTGPHRRRSFDRTDEWRRLTGVRGGREQPPRSEHEYEYEYEYEHEQKLGREHSAGGRAWNGRDQSWQGQITIGMREKRRESGPGRRRLFRPHG